MVNIRYYYNKFFSSGKSKTTVPININKMNDIQNDFVTNIANHNFIQFVYTPIPCCKKTDIDFFRFLIKRIDTPKHRMYTIKCEETDEIIFYLIRKFKFMKMKEKYEIYLNYTPFECDFVHNDVIKIIEHYVGHGFNKLPKSGILIGNTYSDLTKCELVLENTNLLRKQTRKNIVYTSEHKYYDLDKKNLSWKDWIDKYSNTLQQTTINTNIIDLSPPITKIDKNISEVFILNNEKPIWDDSVGAYVLNFEGRVKKASIKNTIFLNKKNERIALFGKLNKNYYVLDITNPLSLIQGICLAITCLGKT